MAANRGGHCEVGEGKIMRKIVSAADPDAYVHALDGWRRTCVEMLRGAVRKVARLKRQ